MTSSLRASFQAVIVLLLLVACSSGDTEARSAAVLAPASTCAGGASGASQDPGDCCTATPGVPSCTNAAIRACVCDLNQEGSCCLTEWNENCVTSVFDFGCAVQCGAAGSSGASGVGSGGAGGASGTGGATQGDCCTATPDVPGCTTEAIRACVCDANQEGTCCQVEWNENCVTSVYDFGCAVQCGDDGPAGASGSAGAAGAGGNTQGNCCVTTNALGCANQTIETCVCSNEDGASCCSSAQIGWDSFCVSLVEELGCGSCAP
jgi:hypothetical protein